MEIPPGGEGVLKATLTVKPGDNSEIVYVESNDPKQPRVMLRVGAEGVDEIQVAPVSLDFGELQVGQTQTRIVRVSSRNGKAFRILTAEWSERTGIEAEVDVNRKSLVTGKSTEDWEIALQLRPLVHEPKQQATELKLKTDRKSVEYLRVPVLWKVRHPLHWLEEGRGFLGVMKPGQVRCVEWLMGSDDRKPFGIKMIQSSNEAIFQLSSEPVNEGRQHRIRLTVDVPEDLPAGYYACRVRALTDRGAASTLERSLSVHVLPE